MLGGDLRCAQLHLHSTFQSLTLVLLVHLERRGYIREDAVRFWVAELAGALEYLHRQRILHRYFLIFEPHFTISNSLTRSDIKPDNILLDAMGHAHLTDFNVAIHYSERRLHTSVAGSMAYMAPQVINKKGYSWQIDWWSLGITAWELLFHKRPFEGRTADKMRQSILNDPLRFPEDAAARCSPEGMSAVKAVSASPGVHIDWRWTTTHSIVLLIAARPRSGNEARLSAQRTRAERCTPASVVCLYQLG